MKLAFAVPVLCVCLTGCGGPTPAHTGKRIFHPPGASPYTATLIEKQYWMNTLFDVRIDAADPKHGTGPEDRGWYFVEDLHNDDDTYPAPDVRWASPTELLVTMHTARIEGQVRRRFGGEDGLPLGSITVRYVRDVSKE